MGKSPEDKARSAAKKATEIAMEEQKRLYGVLKDEQKSYSGKYKDALQAIKKAPGSSMADYIEDARNLFSKDTRRITNAYRSDLAEFQQQPRILGSSAYGMLKDELQDMAQQYVAGVQGMGEYGRDRFFALPEQARVAFTASSESPAFNNLKNQEFMAYATGKVPGMTISNDANAMYRPQYTYNV